MRRKRRIWRWLGLAALAAIAVGVIGGWRSFGHRPTGARRARMEKSPQWRDGRFRNPQPLDNKVWPSITGLFSASKDRFPSQPVDTAPVDPELFKTPPATGLRVTWLGHSTVYIEIDGHRILTDPIFSERASPLGWLGPRRFYAPLVALDALPRPDAVLISHDHYDHLDAATITAMKDWDTTFVVPLGVGAHLAYWGIDERHIVELDWWEKTTISPSLPESLQIVCTPARHASGRMLLDNDRSLWASYALIGPKHRVFDSGDTGLFPAMADIGAKFGPFDLTMIEVGQYDKAWPDWHSGPEQALQAHRMLRGKAFLPIHWALFGLAYHGWTEPVERALVAGGATVVLTPRPGQSVEPEAPPVFARWWPSLPWKTAAEAPVVSTQLH